MLILLRLARLLPCQPGTLHLQPVSSSRMQFCRPVAWNRELFYCSLRHSTCVTLQITCQYCTCLCRGISHISRIYYSNTQYRTSSNFCRIIIDVIRPEVVYFHSFYRAMPWIARTLPSQDVCPSVRPSVSLSVKRRQNGSTHHKKFFTRCRW